MPKDYNPTPDIWYRASGFPAEGNGSLRYNDPPLSVTSQPTDTGCSTHKPPPRTVGSEGQQKRRRTKIISLSVCAFVLLSAAVFGAVKLFGGAAPAVQETAAAASSPAASVPEEGEAFGDYRDYFESYYSLPAGVNLPEGETGTGVAVELHPKPSEELTLQEIYEKVSPAVVGIICYYDGMEYSWGTGVVFTADGYIITNTHVLEGADAAVVRFTDGRELDAALIGADDNSDIAVIRVDGTNLPFAEFGDSALLRVGDAVAAIGNPLGEDYAGTMTDGIISAIDRSLSNNGHTMTLLQTNAALNEGNSGGPLINSCGQVIGITNMKIMSSYFTSVEGIGFAIPSAVVKQVADALIENGVVPGEPTIGIVAGSVSTQAMEEYDLPAGVYVTAVNNGSDAKEKGLAEGDIILKVNGIAVSSVAEVNAIKEGLSVGDTLDLVVYRDGTTFELTIELVDKGAITD